MGWPHSMPVTRHSAVKIAPSGADARATRCAIGWRQIRKPALPPAMIE